MVIHSLAAWQPWEGASGDAVSDSLLPKVKKQTSAVDVREVEVVLGRHSEVRWDGMQGWRKRQEPCSQPTYLNIAPASPTAHKHTSRPRDS
jgi:hypothetical protein